MGIKKVEYDWAATASSLEEIATKRVDEDARWRLVTVIPTTVRVGNQAADGYAAWFEWEDSP